MYSEKKTKTNGRILFRITICGAILLAGVASMFGLKSMKKPPVEVAISERALRVETFLAKPEDVEVQITGLGQVQVLRKVPISAEVPGRVVFVNPRLEQGEIIAAGETLLKVDPSDYLAALDSSRANVERSHNQIKLITKQLELDRARLKIIARNRDLAKADYERQLKLYREQKVGRLSSVEKLEQVYLGAVDQAAQLAKAIELYPLQIKEANSNLIVANSRLVTAEKNLARCDIKALFTGRLAAVSVETGQYVSPGQPVLTLTDDSSLEIPVSIDSVEAKKWLRFKPGQAGGWLQDVEPVPCEVRWTDDDRRVWQGHLQRVIRFDSTTRTLIVAVRLEPQQEGSLKNNQLPLIEGMFCSVNISGRIMKNVYRLPRWAVSFKNTVHLAVDNKLKTVPVKVEHSHGEETFVSNGLTKGDQVIITRLVEPLENSRLEILNQEILTKESAPTSQRENS